MSHDNDAVLLRREILIRVARHAWGGTLATGLRRLPYDMTRSGATYRCCVHHERAILRDRTLAALGYAVETRDEAVDLNDAGAEAWDRSEPENFPLTVVDEACRGCVPSRYAVTNACMGCVARPCRTVCPQGCVSFVGGRASIGEGPGGQGCINCGKCRDACPYHAIVHIPVPCEEACPVGAIQKGDGKESIDPEACILCGRCVTRCPFGAVMEKSDLVRVVRRLTEPASAVALVAPSVLGQFPGSLEQIYGAVAALGFEAVYEVAEGAEETAEAEAREWEHAVAGGHQALLATSCCPAWVAASRGIPGMSALVSTTPSPLVFSGHRARKAHPGAFVVFVGPCTAKRREAQTTGAADAVLTFEELGALFVSRGIEVADARPWPLVPRPRGRGFALSGGVAEAVSAALDPELRSSLRPEAVNGLGRKTLNLLKAYARGRTDANLLEVMACEGGCVAGPGKVCSVSVALDQWKAVTRSPVPPA